MRPVINRDTIKFALLSLIARLSGYRFFAKMYHRCSNCERYEFITYTAKPSRFFGWVVTRWAYDSSLQYAKEDHGKNYVYIKGSNLESCSNCQEPYRQGNKGRTFRAFWKYHHES